MAEDAKNEEEQKRKKKYERKKGSKIFYALPSYLKAGTSFFLR